MIATPPLDTLKLETEQYEKSYNASSCEGPEYYVAKSKGSLLDDDDDDCAEHDAIFFQRKPQNEVVEEDIIDHEMLNQKMEDNLMRYFGSCGSVSVLGSGSCGFEFGGLHFIVKIQPDAKEFLMTTPVRSFETQKERRVLVKKTKKINRKLPKQTTVMTFQECVVLSTTHATTLFLDDSKRAEFQQTFTEFLLAALGIQKDLAGNASKSN